MMNYSKPSSNDDVLEKMIISQYITDITGYESDYDING